MTLKQFNRKKRFIIREDIVFSEDFKLIQIDIEVSDILEMIGSKKTYPYLLVYSKNGELLRVYGLQFPADECKLTKLL